MVGGTGGEISTQIDLDYTDKKGQPSPLTDSSKFCTSVGFKVFPLEATQV